MIENCLKMVKKNCYGTPEKHVRIMIKKLGLVNLLLKNIKINHEKFLRTKPKIDKHILKRIKFENIL